MGEIIGNDELIESLIVDCNTAIQSLTAGQYIAWCNKMVEIYKKLKLLQKGVSDDIGNRNKTIETLKEQLKQCGREIKEYSAQDLMNGKKIEHLKIIDEVDENGTA